MVAEHATRLGVGSALIRAAEQWARARGHQRIQLETGAANQGARTFYAALGYEQEEVRISKPLAS
ncbi:GNAT family N-acetyltransferase [Luteipulveratus mongoliensis]|uniref:GNAT family N-acetyltransferase n=1 Tax=Luteipulveratus mongoliensis TaxID=571913 RepID=UPI0006979F1F|nr:GNAT family N-acetyltransferase [Luteipulveratus mongoliensis]